MTGWNRLKNAAWVATILVLLVPLLMQTSVAAAQGLGETSIVTVDAPGDPGGHIAVAFDEVSGLPILAYERQRNLRIAQCHDVNCSTSAFIDVDIPGIQLHHIAFDDAQRLVAVYHTGLFNLWVARCQDKACDAITTEPLNVSGTGVDVELDSLGNPVITSTSSSSRSASLTRCEDPTCKESSSRTIATSVLEPSLELDSNDFPVIAYGARGGRTFLKRCADPVCDVATTTELPSNPSLGVIMELALDPNDHPVLAMPPAGAEFGLVQCDDVDCTTTRTVATVDGSRLSGRNASLAIDSQGYPVLSFPTYTGGLQVVRCLDANCGSPSVEVVDGSSHPSSTSLALDDDDHPVVAYEDIVGRDVKFANCDNATCLTLNRQDELPASGRYFVRSVETGRYLDADPNGNVDTSTNPTADDQWDLTIKEGRVVADAQIDNVLYDTFIDSARWTIEQVGDGTFYIRERRDGAPRYLSTSGTEVIQDFRHRSDRWTLTPVELPNLIGERVTLRNAETGLWLDSDANSGAVNQSTQQRADDVWVVHDVGDGSVYLQNEVSGRFLDADQGPSIDTSVNATSDDRWLVEDRNGFLTLQSIDRGGFVAGLGSDRGRAVVRADVESNSTLWRVDTSPAGG